MVWRRCLSRVVFVTQGPVKRDAGKNKMLTSECLIPKVKIEVEVDLSDGSHLRGYLFGTQDQRISDVLNDSRGFLPFVDMDGQCTVYSKTVIFGIKPVQQTIRRAAPIDRWLGPRAGDPVGRTVAPSGNGFSGLAGAEAADLARAG